jgi:hypothetical protein
MSLGNITLDNRECPNGFQTEKYAIVESEMNWQISLDFA